jgi:gas vesicle protein
MKLTSSYLIIFLFLTSCQLESSKKITEYLEEKKDEIKNNISENKKEIKNSDCKIKLSKILIHLILQLWYRYICV